MQTLAQTERGDLRQAHDLAILLLQLCPSVSLAGCYPGCPPNMYYPNIPSYRHCRPCHHNNDGWIVPSPLTIGNGVLRLAALSQLSTPTPWLRQPPLCRDTCNYYDKYGTYRYSHEIDQPCLNKLYRPGFSLSE